MWTWVARRYGRPCDERPRENYDNRLNLSLWIVGGVKQDATPTKSLAILRWITISIGNIRGTQKTEPYQTVDNVMSHRLVKWKSLEGLGWIPNPTIFVGRYVFVNKNFRFFEATEWMNIRKEMIFPFLLLRHSWTFFTSPSRNDARRCSGQWIGRD